MLVAGLHTPHLVLEHPLVELSDLIGYPVPQAVELVVIFPRVSEQQTRQLHREVHVVNDMLEPVAHFLVLIDRFQHHLRNASVVCLTKVQAGELESPITGAIVQKPDQASAAGG